MIEKSQLDRAVIALTQCKNGQGAVDAQNLLQLISESLDEKFRTNPTPDQYRQLKLLSDAVGHAQMVVAKLLGNAYSHVKTIGA